MSATSVAILCPHVDDCTGDFVKGLLQLAEELTRSQVRFTFLEVGHVALPRARDRLAHIFMQSAFSHAMWIDSDVRVEAGGVTRLLELGVDFACAPYRIRPRGPRSHDAPSPFAVTIGDFDQSPVNRAIRVERVGMGACLITRHVFEMLAPSRPQYRTKDYGTISAFFEEEVDGEALEFRGEDWAFCRRWRELGEIWASTSIDTWHDGLPGHFGRDFWFPHQRSRAVAAQLDAMPSSMAAQ